MTAFEVIEVDHAVSSPCVVKIGWRKGRGVKRSKMADTCVDQGGFESNVKFKNQNDLSLGQCSKALVVAASYVCPSDLPRIELSS